MKRILFAAAAALLVQAAMAYNAVIVTLADNSTEYVNIAGGAELTFNGPTLAFSGPNAAVSYELGKVKQYAFTDHEFNGVADAIADNQLAVDFDGPTLRVAKSGAREAAVYNLAGAKLASAPVADGIASLDLSVLGAGVYILSCGDSSLKFSVK